MVFFGDRRGRPLTLSRNVFVMCGPSHFYPESVASNLAPRCLQDFGLTIDIEQLIKETDLDGSGFIDYEEFKTMMS